MREIKKHERRAGQRRRQITQVAMGLFARQGFDGTTTRRIAEPARVSEVIIFATFRVQKTYTRGLLKTKCRPTQAERKDWKSDWRPTGTIARRNFFRRRPSESWPRKWSSKHGNV